MEINNGKKTKIWKDKWIPGMNHPPSPINDLYRFHEDIAELYLPDSNQWGINLLNRLFDANTSLKIQSLFIDCSKEYVMLWMPSKDGSFSVKSTYKMLTHCAHKVQVMELILTLETGSHCGKHKQQIVSNSLYGSASEVLMLQKVEELNIIQK